SQPLRYVRRDPGLLAVAGSFSGSDRQRLVVGGPGRLAVHASLLDLEGSRVLADAIAARSLGRTGCEGSCRFGRSRGHRYDPRPRLTESLSGVRRAGHLRRSGERRGGHLPRSHVRGYCWWLAQRCSQGSGASVCSFRAGERGEFGMTVSPAARELQGYKRRLLVQRPLHPRFQNRVHRGATAEGRHRTQLWAFSWREGQESRHTRTVVFAPMSGTEPATYRRERSSIASPNPPMVYDIRPIRTHTSLLQSLSSTCLLNC